MPDRNEDRAAVGHLLRRAAFGASPADLAAFEGLAYEEVVERLLADLAAPLPKDAPGFDPYVPGAVQQAWLDRMVAGRAPLRERIALLWHGHFATSDAKVVDLALLWAQHRTFLARGAGRFRDLLGAVSRDPAMIRFLDGNANRKGHPNENYARELQELFTLGIGAYTEHDVREVARAFTGWGTRHHAFLFREEFHDHGEKTVHGTTGDLGGEEVLDVLAALPACHRHVARRLLTTFVRPDPATQEVEALAEVFRHTDGDLGAMLRAIFLSPGFREARARRTIVRSPVELVVAALRAAGFTTCPEWAADATVGMGQILFRPPSVKGWTSGAGWLGAGAMVERLRFADAVAERAPAGSAAAFDDFLRAAFDGEPPAAVAPLAGPDRLRTALASPEFQLS